MLKQFSKHLHSFFRPICRLFETRLAFKVWLKTTVPILACLVCAIIALHTYLNAFLIRSAVKETQQETVSVADKFSNTYKDLTQRLITLIASENFRSKCIDCLSLDPINSATYTIANNDIQSELKKFIQMNGMIESAILAKTNYGGAEPTLFAPYVYTLNISRSEYSLGFDLTNIAGISFLPEAPNPFRNRSNVLPLVVPLYMTSQQYLLISQDVNDASLILYLLFEADAVTDYLKLCCDDRYEGNLFLMTENGVMLNRPETEDEQRYIGENTDFSKALKEAIAAQLSYFQYQGEYIYLSPLDYGNLYIVNIVEEYHLLSEADNLLQLLKILAITCVVVITILCVLISIQITRPLRILMATVKQIEKHSYDGQKHLHTKDELGQLENSLHSMYHIIQQQIRAIQEGERQRYNAEMQMLTEQINPHFLYNTLEFINMEVYRNRSENASQMISNLGEYIRNSLSSGDNQHSIERELEHVSAYVDIMSCRFSKPIDVLVNVPDDLRCKSILKSILQPLVENALKHGFDIDGQGALLSPRIEITAECIGKEFLLSVTDNGAGIDVERADQIMHTKCSSSSKEQHVGLNNVYQRLQSYYGSVKITFSTIPYFKNTVMIHLPACYFDDSGTLPPCADNQTSN